MPAGTLACPERRCAGPSPGRHAEPELLGPSQAHCCEGSCSRPSSGSPRSPARASCRGGDEPPAFAHRLLSLSSSALKAASPETLTLAYEAALTARADRQVYGEQATPKHKATSFRGQ